MNKLIYIGFFISIVLSGYDVGDTISEDHLDNTFDTCFPDNFGTVTFGDYKDNSVIWLNLSASW